MERARGEREERREARQRCAGNLGLVLPFLLTTFSSQLGQKVAPLHSAQVLLGSLSLSLSSSFFLSLSLSFSGSHVGFLTVIFICECNYRCMDSIRVWCCTHNSEMSSGSPLLMLQLVSLQVCVCMCVCVCNAYVLCICNCPNLVSCCSVFDQQH